MAKNYKLNNAGFYAIRRAPALVALENQIAKKIADEANRQSGLGDDGYKTSSQQGAKRPQGRWRTTVITASEAAQHDNAKNATLQRSLDAGRS